jgi:hypothetical protein
MQAMPRGDKVWYEDVAVLPRRWKEFFPTADQTPAEKMNALARLVLYCTLAVFAYNRQPRVLAIGGGALAVISLAFGHRRAEAFPTLAAPIASEGTARCTPPTRDNPFAIALLTDLNNGDRAPACAYDAVKDVVRPHFNDGLIRDSTDVYEVENSQRQFYTMPVTTNIPDTGAFSKFLYGNMPNCKQNMAACLPDGASSPGATAADTFPAPLPST